MDILFTRAFFFRLLLLASGCVLSLSGFAQCPNPQFYDLTLTGFSSNPTWINSITSASDPDSFTLNLVSPTLIPSYSINWGDGSPIQTGGSVAALTSIPHTYKNVGQYTVTVTETATSAPFCATTITGTLISDRKPGASAQPPTANAGGCVPKSISFINKTVNVSPFTTFLWVWDDGTTTSANSGNVNDTVSHIYQKGTSYCNMSITLKAKSLTDSSFVTLGPYNFYDVDQTAITTAYTRLCQGDTINLTDATNYNCNVTQPRKIKWISPALGINTPWLNDVGTNKVLRVPIFGTPGTSYSITLLDSNYCGIQPATTTIRLVAPPKSIIQVAADTICAGQQVTINNFSTGNPDYYTVSWGDLSAPQTYTGPASNFQYTYNQPGVYTIKVTASINGSTFCSTDTTVTITVVPAALANFTISDTANCGSLSFTVKDSSTLSPTSWAWNIAGNTSNVQNPPDTFQLTSTGNYTVQLTAQNALGCGSTVTKQVHVYANVSAKVKLLSGTICVGQTATLNNLTTSNPDYYAILWGDTSSLKNYLNPSASFSHIYYQSGTYPIKVSSGLDSAAFCSTDTTVQITVVPAAQANFTISDTANCGSLSFTVSDASTLNPTSWSWNIAGTTSSVQNPPAIFNLTNPGNYSIQLTAKNSLGCGTTKIRQVYVYPNVTAAFITSNVCQGDTSLFTDQSTLNGIGCGNSPTPAITFQVFNGISGNNVSNLTSNGNYPNSPSSTSSISSLSIPANTGKSNYGARAYGLLCPGVTGNYRFYIASDDGSELWLSTDGNPANISRIAYCQNAVNPAPTNASPGNYTYFSAQQSAPVYLVAGQKYYIMALFKQGGGGDYMQVAWLTPGSSSIVSIPASSYNSYSPGSSLIAWKWKFGNGDSSSVKNPKYIYKSSGNYNVTLTASTGKCLASQTKTVKVNTQPVTSFSVGSDSGCTPLTEQVKNNSVYVQNYYWNWGDGSSIQLLDSTTSSNNLTHNFINVSGTTQFYNISLIGVSAAGCKDTSQQTIKVFPGPIAGFVYLPLQPQCSPSIVTFTGQSNLATKYVWTMGDGTTYTKTDQLPFSHTFINNTGGILFDTVRVRAYSNSNCISETFRIVVVYPEPDFAISHIPNTSTGCSPVNVQFLPTGSVNTYTWNFGDGSPLDFTSSPTHTFSNYDTIAVKYQINITATSLLYGCKANGVDSFTVYPSPITAFLPGSSAGCSPYTATFQDFSAGAVKYHWDFGDGDTSNTPASSLSHTYINNASSTKNVYPKLTTTNKFSCSTAKSDTLSVYPHVTAQFTFLGDSVSCQPLAVSLQNQSVNAVNYLWDFGDGSGSSFLSPTHSFSNPDSIPLLYTIKLIASSNNGCIDSTKHQTVALPTPTSLFSLNSLHAGCTPFTIAFTNNSLHASRYFWNFGNNDTMTTAVSPLNRTFNNGTLLNTKQVISLLVGNIYGCTGLFKDSVTVYPRAQASFLLQDSAGCSPLTSTFVNTSNAVSTSLTWVLPGSPSVSNQSTVQNTYTNPYPFDTSYQVTLIANTANSCGDTTTQTIKSYNTPIPDFQIVSGLTGCSPSQVVLKNKSIGGVSYTWNFGDGSPALVSTDSVLNYTYINNGSAAITYQIVLKANANHCSATTSKSVTVFPKVTAAFVFNGDSAGCQPLSTGWLNKSVNAANYLWNFGDGSGSSLTSPVHSFLNSDTIPVNYTVSLIAFSTISDGSCIDSTKHGVTALPTPVSSFSIDTLHSGCSPFPIAFSNKSVHASGYFWDFGQNDTVTTSSSPLSRTFSNDTTLNIKETVSLRAINLYGCTNLYKDSMTIYPQAKASFIVQGSAGCSPLTSIFKNTSNSVSTSLQWTLPTANYTQKTVSYTYPNPYPFDTSYQVILVASTVNGCSDTATTSIKSYNTPVADFAVISGLTGCSPSQVVLKNKSAGGVNYTWDLGSGDTSTSDSLLSHTFVNNGSGTVTYPITLIVNSDHCSDSVIQSVTVYPKVTAAFQFTGSDSAGCQPLVTGLQNQSVNASNYIWNFGDSTGSPLATPPPHVFTNTDTTPVTYNIILTASGINSCQDHTFRQVKVLPAPVSAFSINTLHAGCTPFAISFTNNSLHASSYFWNFGNNDTVTTAASPLSRTFNDSTLSNTKSVISLLTNNIYGCTSLFKDSVTVYPRAKASFQVYDSAGCSPLISTFISTSNGVSTGLKWAISGVVKAINQGTLQYNYANPYPYDTSYQVTLYASTINSCGDSVTKTVKSYNKPVADFDVLSGLSGCSPSQVVLKNKSVGGIGYTWNFGNNDTLVTTDSLLTHTYVNSGSGLVTNLITLSANSNHCNATVAKSVIVFPEVTAAFKPDTTSGCHPLKVVFNNRSVNGSFYTWNYGDSTTENNNSAAVTHVFENYTQSIVKYVVKLTGQSSSGCMDVATDTITVFPQPAVDVSISGNSYGCSPLQVQFVNQSSGAVSYNWNFGNGNILNDTTKQQLETYQNASGATKFFNVRLTGTSANQCIAKDSVQITAYSSIQAQFSVSADSGCSPLTINTNNTTAGLNSSYNWYSSDGTQINGKNIQKLVYYNQSGRDSIFTLLLTAVTPFGCSDSAISNIKVFNQPVADFEPDAFSGCGPWNVTFDNQSFGGSTYSWKFGSDSLTTGSDSSFIYVLNNPGPAVLNQSVILQARTLHCSASVTKKLTVYPAVSAAFTSDTVFCSPASVQVTNQSSQATRYNWTIGGAVVSSGVNPLVTLANNSNTGDTTLFLTLQAFSKYTCSSTDSLRIRIHPKPKADFSFPDSFQLTCSPQTVPFQNNSLGAAYSKWKFSSSLSDTLATNAAQINHTFVNTSQSLPYAVKLYASNLYGCRDSTSQNLQIFPQVKALILASDTGNHCSGFSVQYANGTGSNYSYFWTVSGLGAFITPTINVLYNNDSTGLKIYRVALELISFSTGCRGTDTTYVKVKPQPKARFSATSQICNGAPVEFVADTTGNFGHVPLFNFWNFGNGDTSYTNAAVFSRNILLDTNVSKTITAVRQVTNTFGCSNTYQQNISVISQPNADFSMDDSAGCSPLSINFHNSSANFVQVQWYFSGNPPVNFSSASNPNFSFTNYGLTDTTLGVYLIATNQYCRDTSKIHQGSIYAKPQANMTVTPNTVVNPGDSLLFKNTTRGNWTQKIWNWNDGTGNTTTGRDSAKYAYNVSGIYQPTFVIGSTHGCADTTAVTITVKVLKPYAKWSGKGNGCGTLYVTFKNQSVNANSYFWDFGDGSQPLQTNSNQSVTHTYVNTTAIVRTYLVTLEASGPGGTSTYSADSVTVFPVPTVDFDAKPDTVYLPNSTVLFSNLSSAFTGNTYNWSFGDGDSSVQQTPTHQYLQKGVYNVSLTVATQYGCAVTKFIPALVNVIEAGAFVIPNAFTPNRAGSAGNRAGTGLNDVFAPGYYEGIATYHLSVFNKWGEMIFESSDLTVGWDGYYKNQLCQEDVYAYKASVRFLDGRVKQYVGDVTLLYK